MQHWTTNRSLILLHIPCSSSRSGREEVKLERTAFTGVNSVCSRRINGLHIQDMDNLFIFFNVLFGYLQELITAGQEDVATPVTQVLETFKRPLHPLSA